MHKCGPKVLPDGEIVWRDDAIIVDAHVHKAYSVKKPGLIIEVRRAGLAPKPWSAPLPDEGVATAE